MRLKEHRVVVVPVTRQSIEVEAPEVEELADVVDHESDRTVVLEQGKRNRS